MFLAEPIFLSIQWEWPNTWKPSIFVRFFWCNLCCKWCDSLYAVNNPESVIDVSLEDIAEQIKDMKCKHIVFTGWEPTLFEEQIAKIIALLPKTYTYEIETNGSIAITNNYNQINISPKLLNSWNNPYELKALDNKLLRRSLESWICFKFVAKGKEDFEEIQNYIEQHQIPSRFVYIMPEWTDYESQMNSDVLQFCLDNEYRYCQRMHILLFWNKKWV